MGPPSGIRRKKTSREHKAAVELASKRRGLSKLLKREGFEPVPLDVKQKKQKLEEEEEASKKQDETAETGGKQQKSREERERERAAKLEERRARATKLMKKTSKGQPLMKNLIGDLVSKLAAGEKRA